jgi:hypothetical protein
MEKKALCWHMRKAGKEIKSPVNTHVRVHSVFLRGVGVLAEGCPAPGVRTIKVTVSRVHKTHISMQVELCPPLQLSFRWAWNWLL